MPRSIPSPKIKLQIEPLSQSTYSQFGTVIQNPHDPSIGVSANQGSALKYIDVSNLTDFYTLSKSRKPARSVLNIFVCSPRKLRDQKFFDVNILERHPYTSQTFIPLGLSGNDKGVEYLVIVAPTLPTTRYRKEAEERPKPYPTPDPQPKKSVFDIFSRARPSPFTNERSPPTPSVPGSTPEETPKGPGMPDLKNIRAFIVRGDQAVTYGPGTWHAPMVVLGNEAIAFVVVQYVNGVGEEDCQEVLLRSDDGEGIYVDVEGGSGREVRAKL